MFIMSYGKDFFRLIIVITKQQLQFNVRKLLSVYVFGIYKYLSLIGFRTLGEYV